jgi:hypothetical protein
MSNGVKIEEQLTCDKCGRFGAFDFGEQKLCSDCYGTSCSCCPEFGCEEDSTEAEKPEA